MRVLVISDVHGNLAALEAVLAEPHDALICLGDTVGYGPDPAACLRRIREEAALVIQGNHDRALGEGVPPACRATFEWLASAVSLVGRAQLGDNERTWLAALPRTATAEYDGSPVVLVHAAPSDPLYRYLEPVADAWEPEIAFLSPGLVLVGHTHLQFELVLPAGHRVVNPGSVGQPKDGDPRAAYAVLERGSVRLCRVVYDVERTIAGLAASHIDSGAVAALAQLLRTGSVPLDQS